MKIIKKVFWASSALVATGAIAPLSITSCACSQVWGYKTPISIGTNLKGTDLDPFKNFRTGYDELVDPNGDPVMSSVQSNYAIDVAHSGYYGYSLPEKWNSKAEIEEEPVAGGTVKWNNGKFEDGTAGWNQYSSGSFVTQTTHSGKLTKTGETKSTNVSEYVYSYKNNIQASNIELVTLIANSLSQYFNYALHYQGTQIGTGYTKGAEDDSNLAVAWGGYINHGNKESDPNRKFFESIFATNAVTGSGKTQAVVRPTHVEFNFVDLPIASYTAKDGEIASVSSETKKMLNYNDLRPSQTGAEISKPAYYSSKTNLQSENFTNFRTGLKEEWKYRVYTYTNVPVLIRFNGFGKSFVNPTKSSGFLVSDFYSADKTIKNTIGSSWKGNLSKFAAYTEEEQKKYNDVPLYSSYQFVSPVGDTGKVVEPKYATEYYEDWRVWDSTASEYKTHQNDFIVLLNFAYKEYDADSSKIGETKATEAQAAAKDRVTMTGLNSIFPACFCDTDLAADLGIETVYKIANKSVDYSGYIFDNGKINNYVNRFLQLVKRSSTEGMLPEAKSLDKTAKALLKFLGYMFGDTALNVYAAECIKTTDIQYE